ncbi:MAG: septation protein SepH [Actinomycetes bacterium]
MADLRLVGLTDDGARLILERADGERDHLAITERLRTTLIRPASAATQIQLDLESQLTPREIQSRIRAGQSLEEVALEAGITVERVERFAGPILHEREHIAQEAANVSVGRDDHGAVKLLGELVGQRLEERGVPRDGMHWDAWRRDDGGWEVRLDYLAGGKDRSAEWVYDPVRRTMTADDDEARWLLEEETPTAVTTLHAVPVDADAEAESHGDPGTDEPAADPPVKSGTQEAIDTLLKGRETVPDAPPAKRKKKASVPSWDEILFGSRKPE